MDAGSLSATALPHLLVWGFAFIAQGNISQARSHMYTALMTCGWKWGALAVKLLVWKLELSGWNPSVSPGALTLKGFTHECTVPLHTQIHPLLQAQSTKASRPNPRLLWRHWTQTTCALPSALKPRNSRLPLGTQLPHQTSRPPLSLPPHPTPGSGSCSTLCPCALHTLSPAELTSVDASKKSREQRAVLHFNIFNFCCITYDLLEGKDSRALITPPYPNAFWITKCDNYGVYGSAQAWIFFKPAFDSLSLYLFKLIVSSHIHE